MNFQHFNIHKLHMQTQKKTDPRQKKMDEIVLYLVHGVSLPSVHDNLYTLTHRHTWLSLKIITISHLFLIETFTGLML